MATQRKHHERQKVQNIQRLAAMFHTDTRARARASPNVIKNIHRSNKALISDGFETGARFQKLDKHKRISFKRASPLNAPLGARTWADARCIERGPPRPPPPKPSSEGSRRVPTRFTDSLAASLAPGFSNPS